MKYRHFKGGLYTILFIVTYVTDREREVYYSSEQDGKIYHRPYSEFFGFVFRDGETKHRFTPIESNLI